MLTLEGLTELLGWCTAINIGVLMFSTLMVIAMRDWISRIHARLFGLDDKTLARAYFQYLANYKIAIFLFNLVPYISMKIIT